MTHFIETLHKPTAERSESLATAEDSLNRIFHQPQNLSLQSILAVLHGYFSHSVVAKEGEDSKSPQDSIPYVLIRAGGTNLGATIQTLLPYLSVGYSRKILTPVVQRVQRETSEWIRSNVRLINFTGALFHADRLISLIIYYTLA